MEPLEAAISIRFSLSYEGTSDQTRMSRVEAGSNTSTVALRVVGGVEKGSLESETVGLAPENDCAGEGQQHL
jgi:hypothetical protein